MFQLTYKQEKDLLREGTGLMLYSRIVNRSTTIEKVYRAS